ncbi:hypothetical protein BJX99DRAFT_246704 [Aspergillus californicus]
MASSLQNVAIIGASGSIGKVILEGLLRASDLNITVLIRSSTEASFPAGVTIRKTDFSDADLQAALKGQDAVISTVGATAFGEQKRFINAAIHARVSRFIPSEFSVDSLNDEVLALLPLFRQKKDVIDYLKSKESATFSWTGLASSGLLDWGIENGFLGYDIASRSATIWDDGDKKFTFTNQKHLGDAVVSVLRQPQATANQYLYVSSVETSQKEILAALEQATSSSWTVTNTTTDAEVSEAIEKLGKGDFTGAFTLVRATCYGNIPGLDSNYVKDKKPANELLGLKQQSVQETIQRVVAESISK